MALTIRPVRSEADQLPRVVGGRNAAPPEWSAWSEEPGHDLAALDGGRTVGGLHASMVGRTEAWLENLRVHPEFQGRGIAGALVKEGEQIAKRYGAGVVRTAIPMHDYAAQGVAERAGYRPILQCVVVETALSADPLHMPYDAPVAELEPSAARGLAAFLERASAMHAWEQLLPLGWRFRRLTAEMIKGLIKDRRTLQALHPDAPPNPPRARRRTAAPALQAATIFALRDDAAVVSVIDGTPPGMQAVYAALSEQSRRHGAVRAAIFAPDASALGPLGVREWTPHPWCPDGLVVVEKKVAS